MCCVARLRGLTIWSNTWGDMHSEIHEVNSLDIVRGYIPQHSWQTNEMLIKTYISYGKSVYICVIIIIWMCCPVQLHPTLSECTDHTAFFCLGLLVHAPILFRLDSHCWWSEHSINVILTNVDGQSSIVTLSILPKYNCMFHIFSPGWLGPK